MLSDPQIRESPRASDGHLLVIGYGNPLRCDDGVGPRVVTAVEDLRLPGVRTMVCHQLTPELADPISTARGVVFVDAAVGAGAEVRALPLVPGGGAPVLAHAADPRLLLTLAGQVFGRCPPAWWLTIPVEDLGFGERLSPLAQRGFTAAIAEIQRLAAGGVS